MSVTLRALELADAEAVAAIYNSSWRVATFDEKPTPAAEFAADFRANLPLHPGVAIEDDWKLVAFALTSPHSKYGPYRTIADFSVYVAMWSS